MPAATESLLNRCRCFCGSDLTMGPARQLVATPLAHVQSRHLDRRRLTGQCRTTGIPVLGLGRQVLGLRPGSPGVDSAGTGRRTRRLAELPAAETSVAAASSWWPWRRRSRLCRVAVFARTRIRRSRAARRTARPARRWRWRWWSAAGCSGAARGAVSSARSAGAHTRTARTGTSTGGSGPSRRTAETRLATCGARTAPGGTGAPRPRRGGVVCAAVDAAAGPGRPRRSSWPRRRRRGRSRASDGRDADTPPGASASSATVRRSPAPPSGDVSAAPEIPRRRPVRPLPVGRRPETGGGRGCGGEAPRGGDRASARARGVGRTGSP